MLQLPLSGAARTMERILVLGAHSDDIEIGCGATILSFTRAQPELEITWVVLGAEGEREREARASASAFLESADRSKVMVHAFPNSYFPYIGDQIKNVFEELKAELDPDLILTHTRHDLHQDHRLVCELTWNTWRNHLILEYEVPKYDGDLGVPNVFVGVKLAREKADLLLRMFATQRDRHWFDEDLFLGLMRIRGMESRAPSGFAEAFTGRKVSLSIE
jgi:LmbE family N-acetylglucosaminyl deacetylase